ncbi:AAA family ATPase [Aestuariivirga sp.]|uniref:AAA family ATPase n=1 Tax=Aestuariivirga sp. TaxID=2650926 RepID=UPI0039E2B81A
MINTLAIAGYRSLRDVRLALGSLNVVTGANGSGKSSLYRAIRLLAEVAQGRIIPSLAREGGLSSTLWAGPETIARSVKQGIHAVEGTRRKNPVSLRLGFSGDDYGYAIDIGLPVPDSTMFGSDPVIKTESVWTGEKLGRSNEFASRHGPSARIRGASGTWQQAMTTLQPFDSMMTHCADPRQGAELLVLRERMRDWRFYDHFRTDRDALARKPQVGTRTPVMAGDGGDLAAALQTIREIGSATELSDTIDDAFPGSSIEITANDGFFEVVMQQHGLLRPLRSAELSDGTLRYLLLTAALLSPRPPRLMVLNEPETSLHPDLLAPLARLIALASSRTQIIVVTHAQPLADELASLASCRGIRLEKQFGETIIEDNERVPWEWPAR